MSQENVEVVKRSIEMFNLGDVDALFRDADPEIEWHDQPELPGATIHKGAEAAAEHLRSAMENLSGYRLEVEEMVDGGANVVVCGQVVAQGRASDVPVQRPQFSAYAIRAGRVRSVRIFGTRAEALEAAGLGAASEGWAGDV
jgi:ketosteroid isomerase-like protein